MVPPNVTKVQLDVMLVLANVTIKLSNVRKNIRVPPNVTKVRSFFRFKAYISNILGYGVISVIF